MDNSYGANLQEGMTPEAKPEKKRKKRVNEYDEERRGFFIPSAAQSIWTVLRSILIILIGLSVVFLLLHTGINYIKDNFFSAVDENDNTLIEVNIGRGSSVSTIANLLVEKGLITNAGAFKYYVDFTDRSAKLQSGDYVMTKSMDVEQIIGLLCIGDGKPKTITFTITEGLTVEGIAQSLVTQGVLKNTRDFLELCRTGDAFSGEFDIVKMVKDSPNVNERKYVLEGYLFPDTYEVYTDASAETIIRKMLTRCNYILAHGKYVDSAADKGMSIDQMMTLASMIEREAKTADFSKVSAVFHNRLARDMKLESCVTVQYALDIRRLILTSEDISIPSLYNTYKYEGLPVGPVSNPGEKAILASVAPNEQFVEEQYLYFLSSNPKAGTLEFFKTVEEQEEARRKYLPIWAEHDNSLK